MGTANYDYSGFLEQRPQISQYSFGSCKVEAACDNHYNFTSTKENIGSQRIHISNNAYYGHHPVKSHGATPHDVDDTRFMDCEMAPISPQLYCTPERTLGRKRPSDDVSFASFKRFKQEDRAKSKGKPLRSANTNRGDTELEELLAGTHGCSMYHFLHQ